MTYTRAQIQEWKADYDSIDYSIKGNLTCIKSLDHSLSLHHPELQARLLELLDEKKRLIDDDLTLQLTVMREQEAQDQADIQNLREEYEAAAKLNELREARQKLAEVNAEVALHKTKHGDVLAKIKKIRSKELSAEDRRALLATHEPLDQSMVTEASSLTSSRKLAHELERKIQELQAEETTDKGKEDDDGSAFIKLKAQWDLAHLRAKTHREARIKCEEQLTIAHQDFAMLQNASTQADVQSAMQMLQAQREHKMIFPPVLNGLFQLINQHLEDRRGHEYANTRLQYKKENVHLTHTFLDTVNHHPQRLFQELQTSLNETISEYDTKYPLGQREIERKAIFELQYVMNELSRRITNENVGEYYWLLMGLVYRVSEELVAAQCELGSLVKQALTKKHLLCAQEAKEKYAAYRHGQYLLSDVFVAEEFRQVEKQKFASQLEEYRQTLGGLNNKDVVPVLRQLYSAGDDFQKDIDALQKQDVRKQMGQFDYKYFTSLLRTARDVIAEPYVAKHREALDHLLGFNPDRFSNQHRKWRGFGLMMVGLAVIVTSIVVGVVCFGISSPLTFIGCGLGAALMLVGGAVMISGRQKGFDKHASQLVKHSILVPPAQPRVEVVQIVEEQNIEVARMAVVH